MNTKDFIREHIQIDERHKISRKLQTLSSKYKEFARYIDLIQKEDVGVLFFMMKLDTYICYSKIRDNIKRENYKRWINYLISEDFIEEVIDEKRSEYLINNNISINANLNVYELTKKGVDFISINYIKEYLETEYEVEE